MIPLFRKLQRLIGEANYSKAIRRQQGLFYESVKFNYAMPYRHQIDQVTPSGTPWCPLTLAYERADLHATALAPRRPGNCSSIDKEDNSS